MSNNSQKLVGRITPQIAMIAGNVSDGDPIYIGTGNIEHIKTKHPREYQLYFSYLEDILNNPDYININTHDGSIRYLKVLAENVVVGVRVSANGVAFARTLYLFNQSRFDKYLKNGDLIPVK